MNKSLRGIALALCLVLASGAGAAPAQAQEHHWGEWVKAEGSAGHTAACVDCGVERTASCANFSVKPGSATLNVCANCGACGGDFFELISDASAVPVEGEAENQRGRLVVRGKEKPFPGHNDGIRYAFTLSYDWNGGLATFKNRVTATVPVRAELSDGFRVYRVSVVPGDDFNIRREEWIEIEYAFSDGILTFETKTPALYLIIAG